MQERLQYINHMNEVIDFGRNGIYVSSNDLHDYDWTPVTRNDRISGFRRGIVSLTLPVVIFCSSAADGLAARNLLLEVAEKDITANKPGKIVIGDYYYRCYIVGSKKSNYLKARSRMDVKLSLSSDAPFWVRESRFSFRRATATSGVEFPFDYPFDYTSSFAQSALLNTNFASSNFRLTMFGPCESPGIYIAGHLYNVQCSLQAGEYVTVDSSAKTIVKVAVDGTTTNLFNSRNRASYIFEKIPPGSSAVSWVDSFDADIVLLEERSEPKWT